MAFGGNPLVMKEINTNLVRRVLRAQRSATRQQLAAATGLSIVTVAAIAGQLILAGEALEGDQVPSNGGRPSRLVEFNAGYAKVLALFAHEIAGRDRLSLRVANLYGECVESGEEEAAPESLAAFEPLIDRMLARHPLDQSHRFRPSRHRVGGHNRGPGLPAAGRSAHHRTFPLAVWAPGALRE